MKKKKHKFLLPIQTTERAQQYFNLWQSLIKAHEESEIDPIRRSMSSLWMSMDDADKQGFHQISR